MAKIKKIITSSSEETIKVGMDLSKNLRKGSIVAFLGDLGSGKTTFIKGIVKALSEKKDINVNSPTFVYLNIYDVKIPVYHFDLYRIKDKNEFYSHGFEEYFSCSGVCLIEWSENILDILPKDTTFVKISHQSENEREIEITNAFK
ncbi:MAG: tRNA threonylcarbamoyladenosine biosynthesis protein TsaE [Candidatus Anoxychlamydiales bacterium]|nr:tRNA threonylcarbamoyladenosine biosynthesis protein TsaE [Candidatus Anoxychlamydiales bacterium]